MSASREVTVSLRGIGRAGRVAAILFAIVGSIVLLMQIGQLASNPVHWLSRVLIIAILCGAAWCAASVPLYLADRK